MFIKTKFALAAVLLASMASVTSAQARATGIESAPSTQAFAPNTYQQFQSAPARLRSDGAFVPDANQVLEENSWLATQISDHASSPYAGGGGK
jgi:hypothetical protein